MFGPVWVTSDHVVPFDNFLSKLNLSSFEELSYQASAIYPEVEPVCLKLEGAAGTVLVFVVELETTSTYTVSVLEPYALEQVSEYVLRPSTVTALKGQVPPEAVLSPEVDQVPPGIHVVGLPVVVQVRSE